MSLQQRKNTRFFGQLTILCLLFLFFTFMGCGEKAENQKAKKVAEPKKNLEHIGNIHHISDIHFNPFYDTTLSEQLINSDVSRWEDIFKTSQVKGFGTVGTNETNYNLLISSLKNMAKSANKPDFIIFTGDFIAHEFQEKFDNNSKPGDNYHAFIDKVFTFIAKMFDQYAPATPVYFSLGNNDSYSGDYKIIADGEFLHKSASILSQFWLENPANKTSFAKTYPTGGYYTVNPPGSTQTKIISLNSIFFSVKHPNPEENDPAVQELIWFEEQLKELKQMKQKAWLLLHIPPGANVYSSVHDKTYEPMWQDKYNSRFMLLLEAYAPEVTAGFCGHTHMDDWRILIGSQKLEMPLAFIRISPAISPQFGNNPGYQNMTYNRQEFSLIDYDVIYMNLASNVTQWEKEYNFKKAYHQTKITPMTIYTTYKAIKANPTSQKNYITFYGVSNSVTPVLTENSWQAYWCGISRWEKTDFENCLPAENN